MYIQSVIILQYYICMFQLFDTNGFIRLYIYGFHRMRKWRKNNGSLKVQEQNKHIK